VWGGIKSPSQSGSWNVVYKLCSVGNNPFIT
jgi:hypothetical protein